MATKSSTVLVGGALLVAAAAATSYFTGGAATTKSSSRDLTDIDDELNGDDDGVDYITEADIVKIFDRLFLEMQGVVASLSQQIQQIQMSGQMIPEKQLRQLLKSEFERALQIKQAQALDENGVDEDCLKEAVWEMLHEEDQEKGKHAKAKQSVERFQKLWENISGEAVIGQRPGQASSKAVVEEVEVLPADKVIAAAEVYFGALTKAMEGLVNEVKAQGGNLQDPAVAQQLHMQFASVANDKGEEALQTLGITLNQFQKSIEANAQNPTVGRSLAMLQMQQQQNLMKMGIKM